MMKVSEVIKNKMRRIAKLTKEVMYLSREIDDYFIKKGFDIDTLRSGDGTSLDELDYGNDITDDFCKLIEEGRYKKRNKNNPLQTKIEGY